VISQLKAPADYSGILLQCAHVTIAGRAGPLFSLRTSKSSFASSVNGFDGIPGAFYIPKTACFSGL
jgi:hypothetical protein